MEYHFQVDDNQWVGCMKCVEGMKFRLLKEGDRQSGRGVRYVSTPYQDRIIAVSTPFYL